MTTTLNAIRSYRPCVTGWAKLLTYLNKTQPDDEPLSLLTVLESNGLDDAVWCLRTEPTLERTIQFALAVARRVEHLSPAAKALNDITEQYINGQETKEKLTTAAYAVKLAYDTLIVPSRYAAFTALYKANTARYPGDKDYVVYASGASVYANHTVHLASSVAHAASGEAYYAAERQAQTDIFKEIFA
jgi:hypothetical protein